MATRPSSDLSVGAELEVDIVGLDSQGAGVARGDGELHVPGALPGERVRVRVEHVSPHRAAAWGAPLATLRPASNRVAPACPAFGRCGGCTLQHLAYPAQLEYKRQRVVDAMVHAFGAAGDAPTVGPAIGSPLQLGYRNRAKLVASALGDPVAGGAPGLVLGAYEPRSHRVVDLAGCRTVAPELERTAGALVQLGRARGVVPYDEATGRGQLRYVILRSNRRGDVLAWLVAPRLGDALTWAQPLAAELAAAVPNVSGVVLHENGARGNSLYGDPSPSGVRTLWGRERLVDNIGDVELAVEARTFFQVNRDAAALLYREAVERAEVRPDDRVLDLYAGAGTIARTFAPRVAEVVAVEVTTEGAADCAAGEQPPGLRTLCQDAGAAAAHFASTGARFDLVVVDPPRKGCEPELLRHLATIARRSIVYVSCCPETLARDLERLHRHGMRPGSVAPVDLFPGTPHVECVVALHR
jgi:23S rRNA (uracil1939-C5)-methyltransferase